MNNNQSKRYKIVEKNAKIIEKHKSNIDISRTQKIIILIIAYFGCIGVILGLIFTLLY